MKKTAVILAMLCVILSFPLHTHGQDDTASNITSKTNISQEGFSSFSRLTDGQSSSGAICENGGTLTLHAKEPIGSIYILFNSDPTEWKITSSDSSYTGGKNGFLHEYIDISEIFGLTSDIKLEFDGYFSISELYIFSCGDKQDWVQIWNEPCENADLLLYSAHSDDDQLFFAGLIPLYVSKGYRVQVAYLTYHPESVRRRHELLDGLWTAGTRYYPIYEKFDDFLIESLDGTIDYYERLGTSYEELENFVIETTRRTKPLVVVTHDINGEYKHGMHMLLSKLVCDSVQICPDETKYPASASKYGTWTVQKTYIHLYGENKIVLDIDTPLEYFGGKTAFQVSQQAFLKHYSQSDTWFYPWLLGKNGRKITSSKQISKYNPAYYGLYDSAVGSDTKKNDMFENIVTYSECENCTEKMTEISNNISDFSKQVAAANADISALNDLSNAVAQKNTLTLELKNGCDELSSGLEQVKTRLVPATAPAASYTSAIIGITLTVIIALIFFSLPVVYFKRKSHK